MSVSTSKGKYRKFQPAAASTFQIPYYAHGDGEEVAIAKLEQSFRQLFAHQVSPEEIACVILEPVLGEGGYIVPPKGWLKRIFESSVMSMDFYSFLTRCKQDLVERESGLLRKRSTLRPILWLWQKGLLRGCRLAQQSLITS